MKKSPTGSKILSIYAIVFAGIAPLSLAFLAMANGIKLQVLPSFLLSSAIVFLGVRVFRGNSKYLRAFAICVMLHYLGVTVSNIFSYDTYPIGSRAHQMAMARMIRGVLFASVYCWYYLLRKKTREGFSTPSSLPVSASQS